MNGFAARRYAPRIAAIAAAATGGRPGPSGPAILPGPRALLPRISALSGISFRRPLPEWPATLGRLGSLEIRLATSAAEIRRAQLRFRRVPLAISVLSLVCLIAFIVIGRAVGGLILVGFAATAWSMFVRPLHKRRYRKALAKLPSWEIEPD